MELVSCSTDEFITRQVANLNENQNFELFICKLTGLSELPVFQLIVADSDFDSYNDTVNRYSRIQNVVTNTADLSGVAKTICKNESGCQRVYIIIMSDLFLALLKYLEHRRTGIGTVDDITCDQANIFFHELGHAFHRQYLLHQFDYSEADDHEFDMRTQAREYYKQQAISLFSEYFAQLFAEMIVPCTQRFDDDTIIAHVKSLPTSDSVVDHAWHTAYMFAFLTAHNLLLGKETDYRKYGLSDRLSDSISKCCSSLIARFQCLQDECFNFTESNNDLALRYASIVIAEDAERYDCC